MPEPVFVAVPVGIAVLNEVITGSTVWPGPGVRETGLHVLGSAPTLIGVENHEVFNGAVVSTEPEAAVEAPLTLPDILYLVEIIHSAKAESCREAWTHSEASHAWRQQKKIRFLVLAQHGTRGLCFYASSA